MHRDFIRGRSTWHDSCGFVCKGQFLPSNDDPVAVRMVSDKSMKSAGVDVDLVDGGQSSHLDVVSLVAVFAGAAVITVVSLAAFVAVYVYVEAVRNITCIVDNRVPINDKTFDLHIHYISNAYML